MVLALALVCPLLAAQGPAVVEAEEDLLALEAELVTAASGTAESVDEAPASVTLLHRDELRHFAYASLADALAGVRGLYTTNDRFYTALGVRGMGPLGDYGNRVQIQIDGHTMNDDWIFSSYIGNDHSTDIDHVERIEVIRGPGSALYGTGAFFGVANVVTPNAPPPYSVRAGVALADRATLRAHVDGGAQVPGGPGYWLSAAGSLQPPLDYQTDARQDVPWVRDGRALGVDREATFSTLGKVFWGDFTLAGSFHQRDRLLPNAPFEGNYGDVRNTARDRRGFLELRHQGTWGESFTTQTRAWLDYQGYAGRYTSLDPDWQLYPERVESSWGGAEWRAVWRPLPGLRVIGGLEDELHPFNRWERSWEDDAQSTVFNYLAGYSDVEWRALDWLILDLGARADLWTFYGPLEGEATGSTLPALNPRAAILFVPNRDNVVKLMAGQGFRVPSVYEFSYSEAGTDFSDGSPVRPELIHTLELEGRHHPSPGVVMIGALFANRITDFIDDSGDFSVNSPDPITTLGLEVEARYEREGHLFASHYSVQRTRVGDPLEGDAVANSPEHLAALHWYAPLGQSGFGIANRVRLDLGRLDRELLPTPPSALWDATLSLRPGPFEVAVGVRNLLDAVVEHPANAGFAESRVVQDRRSIRLEFKGSI